MTATARPPREPTVRLVSGVNVDVFEDASLILHAIVPLGDVRDGKLPPLDLLCSPTGRGVLHVLIVEERAGW